ncbi:MAG: SDR family NAD(P)-dependent oxidoreductase [Candidatus Avoscillospira sp.]
MKTAVITGASAGLGQEFVRQIQSVFPEIREYWLMARRADRLASLAETLPGVTVKVLPLDLTGPDYISELSLALERDKPEVSLLVGCAGCGYLGNFDESPLEEQLRMLDLNIRALTAVTRLVLPYMPKGGRIIHISSIASFVPNPRMTIYSATKSFVSAFSRGLHEELKPRGISVTAVCPGPMDTEFIQLGRIKGNSRTFDVLPYCDPVQVVHGALTAAKKGKAVYTPKAFYKFYRVLSALIPHAILIHAAKT